MSRGIPPGVHLMASGDSGHQLRILGDDARGYLLAGLANVLDTEQREFWFANLAEAIDAAARLGVPADAWTEIMSVDEVQTRKGG